MLEFFNPVELCGGFGPCAVTIIVSYLFGLLCAACGIVIVLHAFRKGAVQGLLALLIPPYLLYYAFARFEHRKKALVVAGWLASPVVAAILGAGSTAWFGPDITEQLPQQTGGDLGGQAGSGGGAGTDSTDEFEGDLGMDLEGDLGIEGGGTPAGDASSK